MKRTGHSLGRRRTLASLLVFSLCLAYGAVSKAEKSKAPREVDEAEQRLRKDLGTTGAVEVQFHSDTGDLSYRSKDNQSFGFNLVTLVSTVVGRDEKSGIWRVTYVSYTADKPSGGKTRIATASSVLMPRCGC